MKLIVLNLPRNTTTDELAQLFKTYGQVTSSNIVMDNKKGTSKGFGFIEMDNVAEANAAIAGLHGKKILNNKIRVKASK